MQNPRYTAYKVLLRCEESGGYSNIVLNSAIKEDCLSGRDASLASRLAYGVLERKLTLDHIISRFSKIKPAKISADVLTLLRMGVYQLIFMNKIPPSAAVNESVNIAKKLKMFSATGFINGVLRSVSRDEAPLRLPDISELCRYLSVKFSFPEELAGFLLDSYGRELTEGFFENSLLSPPVYLRVNTLKTDTAILKDKLLKRGITAMHTDYLGNAMILDNPGTVDAIPEFADGEFHIQDLASQICCMSTGVKPGMTIVDVCSAPGGKSFTLAQEMNNKGLLYAFDMYDHKIKLIADGAKRLGISVIKAEKRDALSEDRLTLGEAIADVVLCDVPCSGLGAIRRKPEIKYKRDLGLNSLPSIQYRILNNSKNFVKPGGVLVYSTCTLNPKENNKNADRFLQENVDFEPIELNIPKAVKRGILEPCNQITLFPQLNNTDGFFISVFKRKDG